MPNGDAGKEWILFYNSNADFQTVELDYDTPTWTQAEGVQDITVRFTKEQLERRRRGGKVVEFDVNWGEFSIEFNLDYDRANAFVTAVKTHAEAHDASFMHLMVLDGANVAGSKGYEMPAKISTLDGEAPISGKTNAPLVALPAYEYVENNYKEWTPKLIS